MMIGAVFVLTAAITMLGIVVGGQMKAFLNWLRGRDVSKRPPEPSFAFCGVSFSRADPAALDAEWQQVIFKQMAKSRYFELRSIE
jgi:hypothetical protein